MSTEILEIIVRTLSGVREGQPQNAGALTLLALFALEESKGACPLFKAIEDGSVEVTELGQFASVPDLLLIKKNNARVFLLEGEMLSGGKQNRVVNTSMIVDDAEETRVPVTCVEEGRWNYRSVGDERFQGNDTTSFGSIRSELSKSVWHDVPVAGSFRSNQGEIWDRVTAALDTTSTFSGTSDISAVLDSQAEELNALEQQFSLAQNQAGHAAYLDGQILVLEFFGASTTYREYWSRLVRALIADSLLYSRVRTEHRPIPRRRLDEIIDEISRLDLSRGPSPGVGIDVRLKGQGLHGSALIVEGMIEHMVVHWNA